MKKNSYVIRRSRGKVWIAPSREVQEAQKALSIQIMVAYRAAGWVPTDAPVAFSGECDPRGDLDNALGIIFDALQKSGVIRNDNQICGVHWKRGVETRFRIAEIGL